MFEIMMSPMSASPFTPQHTLSRMVAPLEGSDEPDDGVPR